MEQERNQKIIPGMVFYTSWGYDQTNYDYIVVKKISPSGKTCICQLAKYDHVGYSGQCNVQKPKPVGYGYEFRMRIDHWRGTVGLRGSYPFCSSEVARLDPGEKPSMRLGSFSLAKENQVFHETDSIFGH